MPEPTQPTTPRRSEDWRKECCTKFAYAALSVVSVLYCAYFFWLGGESASITVNSRNGFDGDVKIKDFPGTFYKHLQVVAVFGIMGGAVMAAMLLTIVCRANKKLDNGGAWVINVGALCVCNTAICITAILIYVDYLDLGKDFVISKYDPHDSRYSTFIPAQLSTIIVTALPTAFTLCFVLLYAYMTFKDDCCS